MSATKLANIIFTLFAVLASAQPELTEVWVAVEDKLEVLTIPNKDTVSSTHLLDSLPAKHIIGLSAGHVLNGNPVVFATTLDSRGPAVFSISKQGHTLIATDNATNTYLEDIALDRESRMLYLTSKTEGSLMRVEAKEGAKLELFLTNKASRPTGITIDPCSRRIFWTDSSRNSPAIFSCPPASPNCTRIISSNLAKPRALAVDPIGRRLFWSDTYRGTFTISSSWLDGTGREVVAEGLGQEPFGLAVHEHHIYWTDWTTYSVYRVSKDGLQSSPERVESFSNSKPHSLAIVPSKPLKCRSEALSLSSSTSSIPSTSTPDSLMSTATDWVPAKTDEFVTDSGGEAASEGACHNFCLGQNASCFLRESGPECECPESRSGSRCEVDPCSNFCLQHSTGCRIVEGAPECFCPAGWSGDRCQLHQDSNIPPSRDVVPLFDVSVADLNILVIALAVTSFILLLLTGALVLKVFRLKQRPRIVRKRFISTTAPPVPSENSCGGGDAGDGVRLDIEDCCNMTLCDTPCFEPPTRGPKKSAGRRTGGCQDKRSLLANQDDDSLDF